MTLRDFLSLDHRFRWGGIDGDDCMTFGATWALEVIGVDPARDLRGTYRTRIEAEAIVAAHGGAVSFMGGKLLTVGAKRVQRPQDGDIGVIVTAADDGSTKQIGAIRFGPLWATLSPARVVAKQADFLAAWRLPV